MFKYDKDDGYKAQLTEKQEWLVDGIANYGSYWARKDAYADLAEDIEKRILIKQMKKGIREIP